MSQLIESIYLKDGVFRNLAYHEIRLNNARLSLFSAKKTINIAALLNDQRIPKKGLFKCRILYGLQIESIEFHPYVLRPTKSLKLVDDDSIEYHFKYSDRKRIDELYGLRGECDDVLIVRQGLITDTSYANIVLKKGDQWITPAAPLLAGTMRSFLLEKKTLVEEEIKSKDLRNFVSFKLINSLIGFDMPEIAIDNIKK
jgi:4-amino-4-deoxychorismate lyase